MNKRDRVALEAAYGAEAEKVAAARKLLFQAAAIGGWGSVDPESVDKVLDQAVTNLIDAHVAANDDEDDQAIARRIRHFLTFSQTPPAHEKMAWQSIEGGSFIIDDKEREKDQQGRLDGVLAKVQIATLASRRGVTHFRQKVRWIENRPLLAWPLVVLFALGSGKGVFDIVVALFGFARHIGK